MQRLHSLQAITQIGPAAIAIGMPRPEQRHIGVLHRDPQSGQPLMLHLEWHHRLTNGEPDPSFLWVELAVHPRRLIQVAAICRLIWRASQTGGIPYGFTERLLR